MNTKVIKTTMLGMMILWSSMSFAITASEVFDDGKRAFDSGRWQEAGEFFGQFLATWPESKLKNEALYYHAVSAARTLKGRADERSDILVDSIESSLASLTKELPDKDLSELRAAVKLSKAATVPTAWSELTGLSPAELKHCLQRGWHPEPHKTPMETLHWEFVWTKSNKTTLDPELESSIALLKARALWQVMLSPLSSFANSDILKTWNCWPVHTCFEKTIDRGFNKGNPEIKRELALLGYHYDCFRSGGFAVTVGSPLKSRWFTYLSERGINLQEAWCPR